MKVFISWSGPSSKQVAIALRDWLPNVLQSLDPFMSSEDIDKGARWGADIAGQLDTTNFGIVCLTKDNLDSPWLNFEVGALSKSVEIARVTPFLHGVTKTEVRPPLGLFQATDATPEDVLLLVKSLNAAAGALVSDVRLAQQLDMWWPQLQAALDGIPLATATGPRRAEPRQRSDRDVLEELLSLTRELGREQGSHGAPQQELKRSAEARQAFRHGELAEKRRQAEAFVVRLLSENQEVPARVEQNGGLDLQVVLPPRYTLSNEMGDELSAVASMTGIGLTLLD